MVRVHRGIASARQHYELITIKVMDERHLPIPGAVSRRLVFANSTSL